MAHLRFKDLVFDVTADDTLAPAMATFWASLLSQPLNTHEDGDFHLEAPEPLAPSRLVWIDRVPERAVDASRVHVSFEGGDAAADQLISMGAEFLGMVDSTDRLFRAPDGLIVRLEGDPAGTTGEDSSSPKPVALYVESTDPNTIAGWWQSLVGGDIVSTMDDQVALIDAEGFPYARFVFVKNAGAKLVKNRMHWDVLMNSIDVPGLITLGATLVREPNEDARWWVLQDPDGNEFCAFNPKPV